MAAEVTRAVLDTSVLVPKTSRRDLQQIADAGLYEAIWSSWIVAELNRVLTVRWLEAHDCDLSKGAQRLLSVAAKNMMRILLSTFILVDPPWPYEGAWDSLADSDDAPVWAAAVASGARYVISEDSRHYPPADEEGHHRHRGIEYLGARDFIRLLLDEDPTIYDIAARSTQ